MTIGDCPTALEQSATNREVLNKELSSINLLGHPIGTVVGMDDLTEIQKKTPYRKIWSLDTTSAFSAMRCYSAYRVTQVSTSQREWRVIAYLRRSAFVLVPRVAIILYL